MQANHHKNLIEIFVMIQTHSIQTCFDLSNLIPKSQTPNFEICFWRFWEFATLFPLITFQNLCESAIQLIWLFPCMFDLNLFNHFIL
jgi:hypothetical protein